MLKPFLLLSAAVLFVFAASSPAPALAAGRPLQDAGPSAPSATNPVKPTAASQEKAKKLFAVDCAMCHGETGDGKSDMARDMQLTVIDWTDPKSLANRTDGELFKIIRNGKDKMPPEDASRAKNDDVWNLIIYIRNLSKGQPAAAAKPAN